MEKEKKVYPSQVNTKTISTRIPTEDYVALLQESLKKGITLSDYLLLKIYGKPETSISGIEQERNSYLEENENHNEYEENSNSFPLTIKSDSGVEYEFEDEADVLNTIRSLENKADYFQHKAFENRMITKIDFNDVNIKNLVFISIIEKINSLEWDRTIDKVNCRKDFKIMWKELFD
jgi:hypothetical protein